MVVAIVDGGEALERCLAALREQDLAGELDVIVPTDARSEDDAASSLLALHERVDRQRAAGLAAARGEIVALLEDRVMPRRDWARRLLEAHAAKPEAAVIGGAVAAPSGSTLEHAVYYCDYGRYQPPFSAAPAAWLSDVNVSYKRAALERTRVWQPSYHETGLHDALRAAGETLWLSRELVVGVDRGEMPLAEALHERFAWARLYAGRRAREVAPHVRAALCVGAPLLALLLLARQTRLAFARGRHVRAFARALPLLALLDLTSSLGELTGYLTGRATSRRD